VWRQRLRWRLRGAWQWPVFGLLVVFDAALAAWLPWTGEGADAIGAFLFAGFLNLLAVAVLAPFLGMALRRRRRDLPFMIARDYARATLLVLVFLGILVGGLTHREAVIEERADRRAVFGAVHDYVVQTAPAFVAGLGTLDNLKLESDRYRACVPGPEKRPLCLIVNTDQSPAGVTRDPSREPNSFWRR